MYHIHVCNATQCNPTQCNAVLACVQAAFQVGSCWGLRSSTKSPNRRHQGPQGPEDTGRIIVKWLLHEWYSNVVHYWITIIYHNCVRYSNQGRNGI